MKELRKVSIAIGDFQRKFGDKRALEIAHEIGADAVDFSLTESKYDYRKPESIYSKSEEEIRAYFTGLYEYAKELGIEIGQTHGRMRIWVQDSEGNDAILKNARLDCLATGALRAQFCVMHGVTLKAAGPDAKPEWIRQVNFERFCKILSFAREFDVRIATETFGDLDMEHCDFFGDIREFIKTYNRICAVDENAKYFTMCVDTGHSNKATRFGNPSAADVIRLLGSNISVLHLNDNDSLTDQHKIPLTGNLDWKDILNALDEVGYCGYYNMELKLAHFGEGLEVETAAFAVKVMKHILKQHYERLATV